MKQRPSRQRAWKRWLRYLYLRFIRLKGTPQAIARGFALGVFWGMFPLPGVQMAIAILSAALLRGSKIAAAAGTWLSNPVTTLPFTVLNYAIGQALLGKDPTEIVMAEINSLADVIDLGSDFILRYLVGCLVVGSVLSIITYLLGVPLITWVQRRATQWRARRTRRTRRRHRF